MENIFVFLGILIALLFCRMFQLVLKVRELEKDTKKEKLTPDLIKINGKTTKVLRNKKGEFTTKKVLKSGKKK